jgi:predicted amidophosphoribosyltransferase
MLLSRVCAACGSPGAIVCPECSIRLQVAPVGLPPPGLDSCASLLRYEGAGRDLLLGLKYRNRRRAASPLAAAMAALVAGDSIDVVTWAPTTPRRRRDRGFDQARLLAVGVGRFLATPSLALLGRRAGPPQTGRDRHDRADAPVFVVRARFAGRVLVVDDVVTTGATLTAAAVALRSGGATAVIGLTAATTALKLVPAPADK